MSLFAQWIRYRTQKPEFLGLLPGCSSGHMAPPVIVAFMSYSRELIATQQIHECVYVMMYGIRKTFLKIVLKQD